MEGFTIVSAVSVALLVELEGSEARAYRYLEAAVKTLYWANVFVLIGLFEGVRRMFEKASDLRSKGRQQAINKATKRVRNEADARLEEAVKRERKEARARWEQAFERFGVDVNGVRMLPFTPEVQRFLDGEKD